jgi:hypothetical protein
MALEEGVTGPISFRFNVDMQQWDREKFQSLVRKGEK